MQVARPDPNNPPSVMFHPSLPVGEALALTQEELVGVVKKQAADLLRITPEPGRSTQAALCFFREDFRGLLPIRAAVALSRTNQTLREAAKPYFLRLCVDFLAFANVFGRDLDRTERARDYLDDPKIKVRMREIKNMHLPGRGLQFLPEEIGLLTGLESLRLFGNNLETLPPQIGNLTELTVLLLHRNKLRILPSEMEKLTQLSVLDLEGNSFETLPPVIPKLVKLNSLTLSYNLLSTLPMEMRGLTELTGLNLEGNRLMVLPPVLSHLPKLKHLFIGDNPLLETPVDFTSLEERDVTLITSL